MELYAIIYETRTSLFNSSLDFDRTSLVSFPIFDNVIAVFGNLKI